MLMYLFLVCVDYDSDKFYLNIFLELFWFPPSLILHIKCRHLFCNYNDFQLVWFL